MGVALYAGPVTGAVIGWHTWNGFAGAAIGSLLGAGVGMALAFVPLAPWSRLVRRGKQT